MYNYFIRRLLKPSHDVFVVNPLLYTVLWSVLLVVGLPLTIFSIFSYIPSITILLACGIKFTWRLLVDLFDVWRSMSAVETPYRHRHVSTYFSSQPTDMYWPSDVTKVTEISEEYVREDYEEYLSKRNIQDMLDRKLLWKLAPSGRFLFDLAYQHGPRPQSLYPPSTTEEPVVHLPIPASKSERIHRSGDWNFVKHHIRQQSSSGCSTSSATSLGVTMTAREPGT